MTIYLASKTLEAIDTAIAKDQGAKFRGFLGQVIPHMKDAYRDTEESFRTHMGASLIGRECDKEIWFGFNWSRASQFEGRMLRLFNRGHLEEARFIAMLLTIGIQVYQQDANGNQFRVSDVGGHFGGSGDGVGIGIPDLPEGVAALLEFKTSGDKPFKAIVANGVRVAKFEHFVQMQIYMHKMKIGVALYMVVNKNDDKLHGELVYYDKEIAERFVNRAARIIPMRVAPTGISNTPGWFDCKFCDYKQICHLKAQPDKNCRTCQFSVPNTENGKWYCNNVGSDLQSPLSKELQLTGCDAYIVNSTFK